MFINNIDIKTFEASVSSKLITPTQIQMDKEKIKLIIVKTLVKKLYKKISIKILFEGLSRDVINKNISAFSSLLKDECDIKFKNLSNKFHCYVQSIEPEEPGINEWMYLNIDLDAYEYSDEITEPINRITSKTINNIGTEDTPAIVEITPSISLVDLIITGLADDPITIKNLTAGKKIIINGEDGTVLENGINKFGDTDLWEWPRLKAGSNSITVSKNSCDITIKYKPRYI